MTFSGLGRPPARPWNGSGRFSRGWRQSTMPQASSASWEKFNRHAPDFEKHGCGILRSIAMRILVLGGGGLLWPHMLRPLWAPPGIHSALRRNPQAPQFFRLLDPKPRYLRNGDAPTG